MEFNMKRIFKTLCLLLTLVFTLGFTASLTACEDIKQIKVNISVFDIEKSQQVETSITVDLYRHLAPETVDAIISYVEKGYYNDTLFYKNNMYTNILFGDYKVVDKALVQNNADYVLPIDGEFVANGLKMDGEFKFTEGTIGLWRDWQASGDFKNNNNEAFNSGKGTLFIPTETKTEYNDYFCILGKIETEIGSDNEKAFRLLKAITSSGKHFVNFTTFYTGDVTVKEDGTIDYSGLTYHQMLTQDFNDRYNEDENTIDGLEVFKAEGSEFIKYNKQTLQLPVAVAGSTITTVYAKITTVTVL